jgi:DNA-binding transcriptional LysR family regulator
LTKVLFMSEAMPLNLRQLHHVVLLADEQHFGRAAERAFLSQSAFSRSIAVLEETVDLRLFDRGAGFVRLTAAGERMVARARRMLSASRDLSRELDSLRSGDLGDLSVGAGPYSGGSLMAGALADLHAQHPSVQVQLEIGRALELQQQLLDERIDFFLADLSELLPHKQCVIEPLGTGPGALYVRAAHPLAQRRAINLRELRDQPFASVHVPSPHAQRIAAALGVDAHSALPLSLRCESVYVLREYALQHDVIISAPWETFALEIAAGRMCQLQVPELDALGARTPLRMELGLVWLRARTPSPAVGMLADLLRARAAASLVPLDDTLEEGEADQDRSD